MVGGKAGNSVEQKTNGKDGAKWLKHGLPHASSLISVTGGPVGGCACPKRCGLLLAGLSGSSSAIFQMAVPSLKRRHPLKNKFRLTRVAALLGSGSVLN